MKNIIKISTVILAISLIMCLFPFSASAASSISETESNDSYASADTIGANQTISANLTTRDDDDYFKFTASEAGTLTISFKHTPMDSDKDWNVSINRDNGNNNYERVDTEYITLNSSGTVTLATIGMSASQTYYITVSTGYDVVAKQGYSITCSFTARSDYETESNNTYFSADVIDANKTISANLTTRDDDDYFKFTASETGVLTISFKHTPTDSDKDWNVSINRDNGNNNYESVDTEYITLNSSETATLAAIGMTASQTYYITVSTGYDVVAKQEYSITCSFTSGSDCETESNDTYFSADVIGASKTISANLTTRDDDDYFKFTSSQSETTTITFQHTPTDSNSVWYVKVYREKGDNDYELVADESVYLNGSENTTITTIGMSDSQTYYIVVSASYNDVIDVPYTITLGDPNSINQADVMNEFEDYDDDDAQDYEYDEDYEDDENYDSDDEDEDESESKKSRKKGSSDSSSDIDIEMIIIIVVALVLVTCLAAIVIIIVRRKRTMY